MAGLPNMKGMLPILTLIFVVALSLFITKAATIALMHTGMSRERARFQARSAFSGAGFTTSESETVVKHPVRRKIIMILILLGNAGVVTAISTLILGFIGDKNDFIQIQNIAILAVGAAVLIFAVRSSRVDALLEKAINVYLEKFTDIRTRSFSRLITVMEDYEVSELTVSENTWLENSSLAELNLPDEGVLVLGIIREDGTYLGVPRGRYNIEPGDKLVVYGKSERIIALSQRTDALAGKQEHKEVAKEHEEELEEQDKAAQS